MGMAKLYMIQKKINKLIGIIKFKTFILKNTNIKDILEWEKMQILNLGGKQTYT